MSEVQFVYPDRLIGDMARTGTAIRDMVRSKDKVVQVTIQVARRMKSTAQLRYYHLLLNLITDHTGQEIGYLKVKLKDQLGYYDEYSVDRVTLRDYRSLADADIETLTTFIHSTQEVCDFLEIAYPNPDQFYESIGYDYNPVKTKPEKQVKKHDTVMVKARRTYNYQLNDGTKGTYQTDVDEIDAAKELGDRFVGRTVVLIRELGK